MMLLLLVALQVDHVTVAGRDLASIRNAFAQVGFQSEYGGPHANGGTEMDIVSFADGSYIELMGIRKGASVAESHYWGPYLNADAGPCAWAARSEDVGKEAARLKAAGIAVDEPMSSGRTRTDGVQLKWETAGVGSGRRGTFFPFLIRDFTPREQRVYPHGKPTMPEVAGVSRVILAVSDLAAALRAYQKAYGLGAPEIAVDREIGARVARFKGSVVALAESTGSGSAVGEHLRRFGPSAFAFVVRKSGGPLKWVRPNGWWIGIE